MRPARLPHDWFDAPLPDNVRIGEGTWLYSAFAFIHYRSRQPLGVSVGHRTGVYNGSFFDLGPAGSVTIGDYCSVVGAIFSSNGAITVGDHSLIAHDVVIADAACAVPGNDRASPAITIGCNAWIGMRAVLLGGAVVGEGAVVGAATVVDFEVPPFAIVAGNPARIMGDVRSRR